MAVKPTIRNLILQPCCKRTLQDIENNKQTGDSLSRLLGASPFILNVTVNVDSNDWDVWMLAMKGVPVFVKGECRKLVQFERIKHAGGDLNKFWQTLYDGYN